MVKKARSKKSSNDEEPLGIDFVAKRRVSRETSPFLTIGQFQCKKKCPVYSECKYADAGTSCGLLKNYLSDLEDSLLSDLEVSITAADALSIQNVLRLTATLCWMDLQLYVTSPVQIHYDDRTEECEVRLSDTYRRDYIRIANEITKNLESLKLTRKQRVHGRKNKTADAPNLHQTLQDAVEGKDRPN